MQKETYDKLFHMRNGKKTLKKKKKLFTRTFDVKNTEKLQE